MSRPLFLKSLACVALIEIPVFSLLVFCIEVLEMSPHSDLLVLLLWFSQIPGVIVGLGLEKLIGNNSSTVMLFIFWTVTLLIQLGTLTVLCHQMLATNSKIESGRK